MKTLIKKSKRSKASAVLAPSRLRAFAYVSSSSQRGSLLLVSLLMLPIAVSLFLLTLTQIEILYAHAQRREKNVQSRLLAESAFAILKSQPESALASRQPGEWSKGVIKGAGKYEIQITKSDGKISQFRLLGTAERATHGRLRHAIQSEILATYETTSKTWALSQPKTMIIGVKVIPPTAEETAEGK